MAQAAGRRHNPWAALHRHLGELRLTTPQQRQLTVAALCEGVAAKDPDWVGVLLLVWLTAPRAIKEELAAQPGLLKHLAAYVAHTHLSSSTGGAAGAGALSPGPGTTRSSAEGGRPGPCPLVHGLAQQQEQQQQQDEEEEEVEQQTAGDCSSHGNVEAAGVVLAHLLGCCEGCVAPPPYQDLAPALHAAFQQRLVCLPALAGCVHSHHSSHIINDQQLLGLVLDAAEGKGPGAAVLAVLALKVFQVLEHSHPLHTLVHDRVTALLGGGTAAGVAFLAAVLQQGGALFRVPGMADAACSGLLAACRATAALDVSTSSSSSRSVNGGSTEEFACLVDLPPAHVVLLQYLWGLVGVVLHLATHMDPSLSSSLVSPAGPLVPALAEALSLLLTSLKLPGSFIAGHSQRPYHDAAWAALLALSECPQTADLLAALLQHQPGLLEGLAASWDMLKDVRRCEEPADTAARLAVCLLLSGSIPGQQDRQQQEQLLVAAMQVWDRVSPSFWYGRADLLMEVVRLPQGRKAVTATSNLLDTFFVADFEETVLGRQQVLSDGQVSEARALLLASTDFTTWLVEGLQQGDQMCLGVVGCVLEHVDSQHTQQLLAIPGLGDALVQCCNDPNFYPALDWLLGGALSYVQLQQYLDQQPQLLQALITRLFQRVGDVEYFWCCLEDDARGDWWLLQQPALLDGVLRGIVVDGSGWTDNVVPRLLFLDPSAVCGSLMRQPHVLRTLLMALGRHCQQQQPADGASADQQDWQRKLVAELACTEHALRALALLPGLLAEGSAELSAGVFEAMHLMQSRLWPSRWPWGAELAATSSKGTSVMNLEGQLQALRQGVEEVQGATAAAAAAMQQLQEQQQIAGAAAGASHMAGDDLPCRSAASGRGSRRGSSHGAQGVQQQGQPGGGVRSAAVAQQEGRSSQRKGRCREAAGELAVAGVGSKRRASGRLVPGKASPAEASAAARRVAAPFHAGDGFEGAVAPPAAAAKRTRR